MKKPATAALVCLVIAAIGGLVAYYGSNSKPLVGNAKKIPIYFTCDTHGRLEPCGCFTGQLGGLTRIQTWLDSHQVENSLLVDVGNSLAGQDDFHAIKYEHILEAFELMGYHALNLGGAEARLPLTTLREIISSTEAPLLSASLIDTSTRDLIAPPTRIVELRGQKIGILAVLDPNSVPSPGEGLGILALDDAISRHLPALASECDEVVLLAFTTEDEMKRLANEFYEVSLIVGGDVRQASQYLQQENQSYLVFTSNQARTVGQVTLRRKASGLEAFDFDIHLMRSNIPQDQGLLALSHRYRDTIRKTDLLVDHPERLGENAIPGVKPLATYVGSDQCLKCHAEEAEQWHASAHSRAFDSLVKKDSEADPSCITCHTVGFGTPSGYRRSFGTEKLTDVGCESCHGPGSEHVDSWNTGTVPGFKFRPLGAGDCLQCHHGEFSRPFDWDQFWPLIEHGKKK
ncbi:multiheme c-type cytochrome [Verrucomicrobiaceae bacterium 227]